MGVYAGPTDDWWNLTGGTDILRTNIATEQIIQDGLVLNLDAGASISYPGSGVTWTDLSGNGNNGTLVNGVGFDSGNGGSLVFDGVNDYVELATRNTNLEFQPTQAFSVFCWVYNLAEGTSSGAIISNMIGTNPYPGWDLWRNTSTTIAAHVISSWNTNAVKVKIDFDYASNVNKWVNIGFTYNGSSPSNATNALNSMNFYINGQLSTAGKENESGTDGFDSTSEVITYNTLQRLRVASRWSSGAWGQGSPLTVSNASIYNRALTPQEIQQNYNATKSRFGL